MAERKWGIISSGATFEALATTIIFFEDSKASLFGRRGKDGGQDARSGDGSRVFQAKHHQNGSAASAIRDAKSEAEKIHIYRQPGHSRHDQWTGVIQWRLVTNAVFNPTDKQVWDTEVAPLFTAQGIEADYWERENLNALLDKHPEIHRSFFENETRAFLSVPEVREKLPEEEPFLQRKKLGTFFGRTAELTSVQEFLASPELFLIVHGAGGTGKTRLLVEAGEVAAGDGDWQVLWANIASMSATGAWFDGVIPERKTLLLVDEPPDETLLQQLSEQLGGRIGRVSSWKVAVAVRSPKDPVLRFLFSPRMKLKVKPLQIFQLLPADAEAMCSDLIQSGRLSTLPEEQRNEAAHELSRRFSNHPVWLTLAIHLLEERGDLAQVPVTAEDLADEYLSEIESAQTDIQPLEIRSLLRWVALLGTINREDENTIAILGARTGAGGVVEVKRKLASLVLRRALVERGARKRFVELKPDVLRDHVLLRWLAVNVGFGATPIVSSDEATILVEALKTPMISGAMTELERRTLVSISRTELILKLSGSDVPLLKPLFIAVSNSLAEMSASQRLALANTLEIVGVYHPAEVVGIARLLRTSNVADERTEGLFHERVIGHGDIVFALSQPLFTAAMGSQDQTTCEAILRELCALAEAEAEIAPRLNRAIQNDGKRAGTMIKRILEGGPHFWGDFDRPAQNISEELLGSLSSSSPSAGQRILLAALLQPVLAVERTQTWSDDNAVHIRTFAIGSDHPGWEIRSALLDRIKGLLSLETTPLLSRVALWHLFAEAHRNVNRLYPRGQEDNIYYKELLLQDLQWTLQVLKQRSAALEEIVAARDIWGWHYKHDSDVELQEAAEKLENLYAENDLAREFEPLLNIDDWERKERQQAKKVEELAKATSSKEISDFVDRAINFLGSERKLYQLMQVAWMLGQHAQENSAIIAFAKEAFREESVSPRSDFGVAVVSGWATLLRAQKQYQQIVLLIRENMDICGSDEQRANLLIRIYRRLSRKGDENTRSTEEIEFFRGEKELFVRTGLSSAFIGAAIVDLDFDWPGLHRLLDEIIALLVDEQRIACAESLIEGIYHVVQHADTEAIPKELSEWLLDKLLMLSDPDDLGNLSDWYLQEIFKRIERASISWLLRALHERMAVESETGRLAVSSHSRYSKYVQPISSKDTEKDYIVEPLNSLINFVNDRGGVGYFLPEMLHDIDPEGVLVPSVVSRRLADGGDVEQARRLSRIGGAYPIGTYPWRVIAKAAIAFSSSHSVEVRRSIFSALGERGLRSWSGTPGEVPVIFISAVENARSALNSETDADLKSFWEWRLKGAEADLREQEERAKEERGE